MSNNVSASSLRGIVSVAASTVATVCSLEEDDDAEESDDDGDVDESVGEDASLESATAVTEEAQASHKFVDLSNCCC